MQQSHASHAWTYSHVLGTSNRLETRSWIVLIAPVAGALSRTSAGHQLGENKKRGWIKTYDYHIWEGWTSINPSYQLFSGLLGCQDTSGYPNTNYIPVAKSRILDAASLVASNLKNNVEKSSRRVEEACTIITLWHMMAQEFTPKALNIHRRWSLPVNHCPNNFQLYNVEFYHVLSCSINTARSYMVRIWLGLRWVPCYM